MKKDYCDNDFGYGSDIKDSEIKKLQLESLEDLKRYIKGVIEVNDFKVKGDIRIVFYKVRGLNELL